MRLLLIIAVSALAAPCSGLAVLRTGPSAFAPSLRPSSRGGNPADTKKKQGAPRSEADRAAELAGSGLKVNTLVTGTVRSIMPYGVFVNVLTPKGPRRTTTGLLHISHISSARVSNCSTFLKVSDPIRCLVILIDEKGQPKLSTKSLEATPGQMLKDATGVYETAKETLKAYQARERFAKRTQASEANSVILGLADVGDQPGLSDQQ
ncbi:hypothetical protein T492DRAFT_1058358 [Pavlovales sp. CCMP2436]|nr:hypothetical protein T492DRAFT_1058358 [Pavlovales sp. CCMP2436]